MMTAEQARKEVDTRRSYKDTLDKTRDEIHEAILEGVRREVYEVHVFHGLEENCISKIILCDITDELERLGYTVSCLNFEVIEIHW